MDVDVCEPPYTQVGDSLLADVGYKGSLHKGKVTTPVDRGLCAISPYLAARNRRQAALRIMVENSHAYLKLKWRIVGGILKGVVAKKDVPWLIIMVSTDSMLSNYPPPASRNPFSV